ncbi:MAG: ribonuclease [Actinomycetota bacterium]|jgi:ribonuclease HI|nr:ribonuclease [Actinomycetota bacterium]
MARWLVLNTDASKPEASGDAAIGVILRQKPRATAPMKVVAYISEVVGRLEIQQAEYHALIEGLKLALRYHPDDLQVFTDSAIVADQICQEAPRMKAYMKPYHAEVRRLLDEIGEGQVRTSWLPRELNREADQRASDAFFKQDGNAWFRPGSGLILE